MDDLLSYCIAAMREISNNRPAPEKLEDALAWIETARNNAKITLANLEKIQRGKQ